MLLRHPLDQEFAGDRPLDTVCLTDDFEGVAAYGEQRRPSLEKVGRL